ncbi:MAG: 2-hydroxyacid dehydrogenase [Spirochaetales bacterium]|nr:2-hydroxyacid dehydrogenase [Spirochaetales bacterium]
MYIYACDLEDWEKERFRQLDDEHRVEFCSGRLAEETIEQAAEAEVLSVFVHSELSTSLLGRLPNLRLIATRSTGFDHIDMDYCRQRNITVCNVPTYGDNTVAEHVFALLLSISHRLIESIDRTRRGDFSQAGLQGFDLRGKTLGVVGTGSIGAYVIGIARGFNLQVLAFDVKPDEGLAGRLGFEYVGMEELLARSHIITLHVPLSHKTHHLIGEPEFQQMRQGVILINTSRGTVVDSQALVEALASGKVAAAGLDVLPEEPAIREEAEMLHSVFRKKHNLETLLADHLLLRLRNVYITPHNAFNTREAVGRILDTTVENIRSFARGQPQNVVN